MQSSFPVLTPPYHHTLTLRSAITVFNLSLCFVVGFLLQGFFNDPLDTDHNAKSTSQSPRSNEVAASAYLDAETAFRALNKVNSQGIPFQSHYLGLFISKKLETRELVKLYQLSTELEGNDASIINLILGLELAYRDQQALVRALKDDSQRQHIQLLFRYWAKGSPELAYQVAVELPEQSRERALQGILYSGNTAIAQKVKNYLSSDTIDHSKLQEAEAAIASKLWKEDQAEFTRLFKSAYASDPQTGAERLKEIDNPALRAQLLNQLLNFSWEDPLVALQTIKQLQSEHYLDNPRTRIDYVARILRNTLAGDIGPALTWLSSEVQPLEGAAIIESLSLHSGPSSKAVLESDFFKQLPDSSVKTEFLKRAIDSIARDNWQVALALVEESVPPDRVESALPNIVPHAYAKSGPEIALQLYEAIEQPRLKSHAISYLSNTWGTQDPLSFLAWVATQPNNLIGPHNLGIVANTWANTDFESMRDFETHLPQGVVKTSLQQKIAYQLVQKNPLEAIEYAAKMESIQDSTNVLIEATRQWSLDDPEGAYTFIDSSLQSEEAARAARVIASDWARRDAAAATSYFNSRRDSVSGQAGLVTSLTQWLSIDVQAATDFVVKLPSGQSRDSVCLSFTGDYRNSQLYPETTLQLIELINDPIQRERAMENYNRIQGRYGNP